MQTTEFCGLAAELDELLSESVASAQQRSSSAFAESIARSDRRVVLFGTGTIGRRALQCLRSEGIDVLAFADNAAARWGTSIAGLDVLAPEVAVSRYGSSATFIVTIYNHCHAFPQTREQLRRLGAFHVSSVIPLRWHYNDEFLPYYRDDLPHKVLLERDAILEAFELWTDAVSRKEFLAQVRWRLCGDFDGLAEPNVHDQYFPAGVIELSSDEFFVDVGAFDGDTVRAFCDRQNSSFRRILALEPDPVNFVKLAEFVSALPIDVRRKIEVLRIAAGSSDQPVRFAETGSNAAAVDARGAITVDCVRLDDLLAGERPTYIKLDIEGAELDALVGARVILGAARPRVAACLYHRQNHLWRIPVELNRSLPGCSLHLRSHMHECWETVCYAVPSSA